VYIVNAVSRDYVSIVKRTIEEELNYTLQTDYGFPKAICRSLVELFMQHFDLYTPGQLREGQLIYRAASYDVPPGNRMEEMKTVPIKLTLFSPEDLELASESQNELIRARIVRLTNEAMDQGALLTQADLSIVLGESTRTIVRRVSELKDEDVLVPTRGNRMDIGPGVSHKTKIVELYLKGYEFTDIKRRTRHSSESIARYLKEFSRTLALHERGHSLHEIRMITQRSEKVVGEYLSLYDLYKDNEECTDRLEEIRSLYREKTIGKEMGGTAEGTTKRNGGGMSWITC
jgi:hypothetical protein